MLTMAVALVGGGLLFLAFWHNPRRALVVWVLSLTMVPPWASVHFLVSIPLHSLVALVAVVASIFSNGPRTGLKSKYDLYFAVFIAVCFASIGANGVEAHAAVLIAVNWVIPYATARILISATGVRFAVDVIAIVFAVVGGLATIELVFDWHPFANFNFGSAKAFELWSQIQFRLGSPRSEWAFGHSIALGGSLALAIPFVARSSFCNPTKAALFFLIGCGVFAAASRAGVVAAIFTAGICVTNAEKLRKARALSFALIGSGILLAGNFLLPQLDTYLVGTNYGDRSSAFYRGEIYSNFLPRIEWFAPYDIYAPGENVNNSIDSAVLDIGLRFGWIVLLLAAFPLIAAGVRVILGKASVGETALVGQIPLLATAALIANYQNWFFVIAGAAVTMLTAPATETPSDSKRKGQAQVPMMRGLRANTLDAHGMHDSRFAHRGSPPRSEVPMPAVWTD
jgi:hypothetical protein